MARMVFLSHRHADKAIANVIRRHLGYWNFPHKGIFQSSASGRGPRIGEPLVKQLKDAIAESSVVILVYTFADKDWSYCMWECGVATDPRQFNTRIVVFQCADDVPDLFKDQLLVKMRKDSIGDFVQRFHMDKDFFPGEEAFAPNTMRETLDKRKGDFLEDVLAAIPAGKREDRYRWDFLTLELGRQIVEEIKGQDDLASCNNLIKHQCVLKGKPFGQALQHFGYSDFEEGLGFQDLIERWDDSMKDELVEKSWVESLCSEIRRAIKNRKAEPRWERLKSADVTSWWFYPIVNHVRIMPDGRMEFDVYMYRAAESMVATAGGETGQQ